MNRRGFGKLIAGLAGVMLIDPVKALNGKQKQTAANVKAMAASTVSRSGYIWISAGSVTIFPSGCSNSRHCYNPRLHVTSSHAAYCPAPMYNCEGECKCHPLSEHIKKIIYFAAV